VNRGDKSKKIHVFGKGFKGMLDTLNDFFWMLPFSSKKQTQIIRQENGITEDTWQKRRDQIMAEQPPGSGRPGADGPDATLSVLCGASTSPVARLSPPWLDSRPRGSTPPLLAPVAQLSAPVAQLSHSWPASADSHHPLALGVQSGGARGRVRSNQASASLPS
jgi:hypothetical protein